VSFDSLLVNTIVVENRVTSTNAVNEPIETFTDGATVAASVQDRSPKQLQIPDIDGPVLLDAVIYTAYRSDIAHLDRIRQIDVTPERIYRVIAVRDPAGRHHHLELDCQHMVGLEEEVVGS
jgi:SPP1 family predicted phage head-tail adaptor